MKQGADAKQDGNRGRSGYEFHELSPNWLLTELPAYAAIRGGRVKCVPIGAKQILRFPIAGQCAEERNTLADLVSHAGF